MHGVGDIFVQKAFEMFGFPPFIPVKEQQIPDPEFPTVSYPNPEETGVLFPRYFQVYGNDGIFNRGTRVLLQCFVHIPH
jgi:phosphomannomutase